LGAGSSTLHMLKKKVRTMTAKSQVSNLMHLVSAESKGSLQWSASTASLN